MDEVLLLGGIVMDVFVLVVVVGMLIVEVEMLELVGWLELLVVVWVEEGVCVVVVIWLLGRYCEYYWFWVM